MFPILSNPILDSNSISISDKLVSSDKECSNNSGNKSSSSSGSASAAKVINDKCRSSSSSKLKFENNLPSDLTVSSFSIINKEQFLNSNNGGSVYAGEYLRKDLKSVEVSSAELLSYVPVKKLNLIVSYDGLLQPLENVSRNWFRNMKLSSDVYSHNASIEITSNQLVRVRISKDIPIGEEISCWFSEDILAYMAIPFLIPQNIQGNNCYTCHICNTSYESPNPLKIHLALLCGQQSIDILWIRLHHGLQRLISSSSSSASAAFHSGLLQTTAHSVERNFIDERFRLQSLLPPASSTLHHHLSAFKPVSTNSTFSPCHILSTQHQFPSSTISVASTTSSSSSVSILANAAAQIETIVSNMGTSKQGHLCIYCGKIYSRKYGLKIHIRTHTGFKPLKCKFCFRPFGDPSNLNKHVRLHLQSNKSLIYKCHFCSKILARRRDLQKHIKTHHCEVICDDLETPAKVSSSEDD